MNWGQEQLPQCMLGEQSGLVTLSSV